MKITTALTRNAVMDFTINHTALAEITYLASSDEESHAMQKRC